MDRALERMDAQLMAWNMRIERLAAKTLQSGHRAGFEDIMHVDELKALHAVAQSKFGRFKVAVKELETAFKKPRPAP